MPKLKPIALDGGVDRASADDLHDALAELRRLGGDDRAVLRELLHGETARDAAWLLREREASYQVTDSERRRTIGTLTTLGQQRVAATHPETQVGMTEALITLSAAGHRADMARKYGVTTEGLKQRRVAAAKDLKHRHAHDQIPAGARARNGKADPLRKYFIPRVASVVLPHVEAIRSTIKAEIEREKPNASFSHVWILTSEAVNALTARIVRAVYPVWAADFTGRHVKPTKPL